MTHWLRKLLFGEPRRLDDPVFGSLLYMGGYWEGAGLFPPVAHTVEYFIDADEHGPDDINRQAFNTLCEHFEDLRTTAYAAIREAAATGECPGVDPVELQLSAVDIPDWPLSEACWEMTFEGPGGQSYSVSFEHMQPSGAVEFSA